MTKVYKVTFTTQRDRQVIDWGLYITAHNQKEARESAKTLWYSDANPRYKLRNWRDSRPHMFYVTASRMTTEDLDHDLSAFFIINRKYATWGYLG